MPIGSSVDSNNNNISEQPACVFRVPSIYLFPNVDLGFFNFIIGPFIVFLG